MAVRAPAAMLPGERVSVVEHPVLGSGGLFAWALVSYGVTVVATGSKLTDWIRTGLKAAVKDAKTKELERRDDAKFFLSQRKDEESEKEMAWARSHHRWFVLLSAALALASCPLCFGWWVGLALGLAGVGPAGSLPLPVVAQPVADAFATAAACWFAHVVLARLGAREL